MKIGFLTYAFLLAQAAHGGGVEWDHLSSTNGALPPPPESWREQTACLVLDADRDGKDDFVIAERNQAPSVVLYRRKSSGWDRYVIDDAKVPIGAGGAVADIDGDGDLDIVFGGKFSSNELWWWENPAPRFDPGKPWVRRTIKKSGERGHHDTIVGDFDGDGRLELVAWNQGGKKLILAKVPADPKSAAEWSYETIFTYSGDKQYEGLASADINGDGKPDIGGGGYWFEHQGGARFTAHTIDEAQHFTRAAAGDLKKGGRAEVVFVAGDSAGPLKWYEWDGGKWIGNDLLGFDVNHGHSLAIGDVDGDGNLDIFCAEMGAWAKESNPKSRAWVFFGDGRGNFRTTVVSTGVDIHEAKLGDLNGDGFLDIASKPFTAGGPRVDVWLQIRPAAIGGAFSLDRWERKVIGEKDGKSMFVQSADIDGDGCVDVVTGAWWFRNPGGGQAKWDRREIGAPLRNLAAIYDFDNDGAPDLLGTRGEGSQGNSEFAWARNDGAGNFRVFDNIERGTGRFLQGVGVARFNAGAPVKVALSWHTPPGQFIQMLTVPPDPSRGVWRIENIFESAKPTKQLDVADIDRDGDMDIFFVGNAEGGDLQWLRNEGGRKWKPFAWFGGAGNKSHRCVLADINRDGRIDGVVGHYREDPGYLAWYEQQAYATARWKEHVIATPAEIYGPMSVGVADMDRDGDLDVVVGEHRLEEIHKARLFVFENLDGAGLKWKKHLVHQGDEHHQGAHLVDIDRDGDLDIVSIGWTHNQVLLYENNAVDGKKR